MVPERRFSFPGVAALVAGALAMVLAAGICRLAGATVV
jgi:hypothetical protein